MNLSFKYIKRLLQDNYNYVSKIRKIVVLLSTWNLREIR